MPTDLPAARHHGSFLTRRSDGRAVYAVRCAPPSLGRRLSSYMGRKDGKAYYGAAECGPLRVASFLARRSDGRALYAFADPCCERRGSGSLPGSGSRGSISGSVSGSISGSVSGSIGSVSGSPGSVSGSVSGSLSGGPILIPPPTCEDLLDQLGKGPLNFLTITLSGPHCALVCTGPYDPADVTVSYQLDPLGPGNPCAWQGSGGPGTTGGCPEAGWGHRITYDQATGLMTLSNPLDYCGPPVIVFRPASYFPVFAQFSYRVSEGANCCDASLDNNVITVTVTSG